ncbi:MAG: hypothetical protein IKQ44_04880 [Lachnospiraceae bacterium]|nr:hypothetical protein [Lachnospiraceae bacterium]
MINKMIHLKSRKLDIVCLLMAGGIIPLAYLSWCFSTIAYKNSAFTYFSALIGIMTAVLYCFLAKQAINSFHKYEDEILVIDICILIIGAMFGVTIFRDYETSGRIWILFAVSLWIIVAGYGLWLIKPMKNLGFSKKNNWIRNHIGLIALIIAVVIMAVDPNAYQFKWDGLLYYNAVQDAHLDSISSVALYGHIAMSSGSIYRFFASLFGDVGIGMIIANIIILLVGICSFYGVIKTIIPDRKEITYTLATACFAFSPFILGMVNYFSTDWFSVCLIVPLIYSIMNRKWILTVVLACVFCCTKEPALIAYTGLCIGLVINDMIDAGGIVGGIRTSLTRVHYYFMLTPYILWMATYKILGQWSAGDGAFALDLGYLIDKTKAFFVLNFNWLIVSIILLGFVWAVCKKRFKEIYRWFIPLAISNICLWAFNVVFKTVNHARYIDSFISISIILGIGMLLTLVSVEKVIKYACALLAVIELISCFVTIDPVSLFVFKSSYTGSAKLLSTGNLKYGDPAIYNKQMLWMEKPLSEAICDCINDGSTILLLMEQGSIYSVDGMSEKITVSEKIDKDIQYWDRKRKCRVPYSFPRSENTEEFEIIHADSDSAIDNIDCENNIISVIYIRDNKEYQISDRYEYIDTRTYSYRGWIVTRDIYRCRG